ncbi:MAG: hypothetical protein DI630_32860 [Gordonia sp. (in: high G+C Gram-positive bacteria)]|nr:MAG: hypothetical protein DI630_32860 [Gordonia sp. (in: high G+C Gram-positive bacteria)]
MVCSAASWASQQTVPSAYLHPRFQGQEPPGFPGRFSVPVVAVLGGTGWARVNDTLGPVLQYTDGRVFTLETLDQMLSVQPFPQLLGLTD